MSQQPPASSDAGREPPAGEEGIAGLDELASALLTLREPAELKRFLRDLCTHAELEAMAHRWRIAQLLDEGHSYLEIAELAGASTTTVTRVAQWLHYGAGGYRMALKRIRAQASPSRQGGR